MRIAISTPVRWAMALAALATIALAVQRPSGPARPADAYAAARAARAGLSQIEHELDAMTVRIDAAVDAVTAAETDGDRQQARAELARLEAELAIERQLVDERARALRSTLAR